MTDYRLAASAEMLFLELPFVERVKHIHERGFEVEIWNWTKQDLNVLAATGATFSNMTGYIEGDLLEEDGIERLLSTAKLALEASKIVDVPRLNMHGTGLDANGQSIRKRQVVSGAEWLTARDTLAKLSTLERMDKMNAVHEANLATMQAHMKQRNEATRAFYNQLSAEQQKVFDAETLPEHSRWKGKRD